MMMVFAQILLVIDIRHATGSFRLFSFKSQDGEPTKQSIRINKKRHAKSMRTRR